MPCGHLPAYGVWNGPVLLLSSVFISAKYLFTEMACPRRLEQDLTCNNIHNAEVEMGYRKIDTFCKFRTSKDQDSQVIKAVLYRMEWVQANISKTIGCGVRVYSKIVVVWSIAFYNSVEKKLFQTQHLVCTILFLDWRILYTKTVHRPETVSGEMLNQGSSVARILLKRKDDTHINTLC